MSDPGIPRPRVRVKVCGITSARDAEAAVLAGVDALGFNTWPGSKRYLDLETAAAWLRDIPSFVTRVALCVNQSFEEAERIGGLPWIDVVQFHGDESEKYCARYAATGRSFLRALRPCGAGDLQHLRTWSTRQILVDAAVEGAYGGTGARADLGLAAEAVTRNPGLSISLAGGLAPGNVAEAVRVVRPYAVDVASGVESAPGRKDPALMRAFVQAVGSA